MLALLGPLLVIVTTAVTVWPGVALVGMVIAIAKSATGVSGAAVVAVLLAKLVSAVVLLTRPVKVWAVVAPNGTK